MSEQHTTGEIAGVERLDAGVAGALIENMSAVTGPMHDWLAGERAYFESQGYVPDEARAMAAATYLTVFGSRIVPSPEQETE